MKPMPCRMRVRRSIAASLALVALAAWCPHARTQTAPTATPDVQLEKLKRPAPRQPAGSLFGPRSWESQAPPRPRVVAPVPKPAPPQAPPLPFVYLGKWIEQGRTIVYLTLQGKGQNFIVRGGERLLDVYQVDAVEETHVVLTYLPLNQRQTLPLAAGAAAATGPAASAAPVQVEAEPEGDN